MFGIIKKIFGTSQSRSIQRLKKIVNTINVIEAEYQSLCNADIKEKVVVFRNRLQAGETTDQLLPEAYALVKNVCRRLCGTDIHVSGYHQKWDMIPYDVQLVGAIAMHQGCIAEMHTGEGKTLTASMPLFLNALTGNPVHLVTVNDYLANRDCEWNGSIFRWLGLSAKALLNTTPQEERKHIYQSDIVYGTASEFGFDYLRDNSMVGSKDAQSQRGYYFAIIDEVDSILIDEARTPLIISGPSAQSRQLYDSLKQTVSEVVRNQKDLCNTYASKAIKTLKQLGSLSTDSPNPQISSDQEKEKEEAFHHLWLVSKGTPKHKTLKRIKENPDLRSIMEKWETYFHSDTNKKERHELLAHLYIIIDERSNEYELTDKGISLWIKTNKESEHDFIMIDLGGEYSKIDADSSLSEQEKMQKKLAIREEDSNRKERSHNLRQLFRAHLLMEKDVDYIVQDKQIVIIDENTGRPQPGRRFSDGLHQSIEAKESVPIQQETQTYATVTLQNYFRLYTKLAGMTGTAITEASEFKSIYNIDVLEIPPHKKCARIDTNDEIYISEREKYNAILQNILEIHQQKRPILIGTESVDSSEKISHILKQHKLPHTILNAKNHSKEAEIIAQAGQPQAITIATNMAGRGTDIKLGEGVSDLGGLHVLVTTRQPSRRIDRQFRGRCGRQGDPGSSKFFISFEDQLLRLFTSPKLTLFLQKIRPPEGESLSSKFLNHSIETAQKRVEQRNYSMRKHTLEYDDVMNKQRQEVYAFRNEVLSHSTSLPLAEDLLRSLCEDTFEEKCGINSHETLPQHTSNHAVLESNLHNYLEWLMVNFPITATTDTFDLTELSPQELFNKSSNFVIDAFKERLSHNSQIITYLQNMNQQEINPDAVLSDIIRNILLKNIDKCWQEHLLSIDHLRTEVGMSVVGQKDPLMEFKHESFNLFQNFYRDLSLEIAHALFKFQVIIPQDQQSLSKPSSRSSELYIPQNK